MRFTEQQRLTISIILKQFLITGDIKQALEDLETIITGEEQ
jgi:hypothetical protein